ncbi:SapC family protein [Sphingomonas sp. CJ20]
MTNPVLLNNIDHHDLTVAIRHGAAYGDAVNLMPIFPFEYEEAQRDFPILLRNDPVEGLQAVVLLGLQRDENLFLVGDRWQSRHIPALVQRGPFSLGVAPAIGGGDAAPLVHVDFDDSRVGAEDGVPLFLPRGGNSLYLDHVTRLLQLIRGGVEAAGPMFAAWDAEGLLRPLDLDVALDDERSVRIAGYVGIDRERLAALPGAALERLNAAGYLAPAFLVAASLANIGALIARKNALAAV